MACNRRPFLAKVTDADEPANVQASVQSQRFGPDFLLSESALSACLEPLEQLFRRWWVFH